MTPPFSKKRGLQNLMKKWLSIIVEYGGNGGREGSKTRHLWKALYTTTSSKYSHVNKQFVFVLYVLRLLACFTLEIQCIKQLGLG